MLKFLCIFCCVFAFLKEGQAEELWLDGVSVADLQEIYKQYGYEGMRGYLNLDTYKYPEIYLKSFPRDFVSIKDENERNVLFIKILTPLALRLNNEILQERQDVISIRNKFKENSNISKKDIAVIEEKAKKYDIFSRLKGTERFSYLIDELLKRIDKIPPSIIITAAAIDTNWGSSRVVSEGNSLYKIYDWHTDKGLKPIGETEDDSYRIRVYKDIYSSIKDFALKINSHPVFASMRNMRYEYRGITSVILGNNLAPYAYGNSALNNYAGMFDYTLVYYELQEIDKSKLADKLVPKSIVRKFGQYVTKM